MKTTLVLVATLFLISSWAWAEERTGAGTTSPALSQADSGSLDGSCVLPDLGGLSPDQRLIAALAAGFQISGAVNKQTAICPNVFRCTSIGNCGAGSPCTTQDIGQCCDLGGGELLCCASGTIKVRQCPCVCTGSPCQNLCVQSTDVTLHCQ